MDANTNILQFGPGKLNQGMNEWMMHLYSALLCIAVHPKRFTIMWGGLSSTTISVQHPLGWSICKSYNSLLALFDWACCHSFIPRRSGLKGFVGAFCQSCLPNKDTLPYFSSLGGCREVSFLWVGGGCSILMHYDLDISTLMCPPILFVV